MICKHCGAEIGDHEKFCRFCGKAQQKLCPKCGAQLSDTAKFCNVCGTALESPKTPAKAAKPAKEKKKRPWGLIAVIAVLCVALIGGGIFAVKTFTEFRDRQQDLEQQLADRDKEDKKDKDNNKDNDEDQNQDDGDKDQTSATDPVPEEPEDRPSTEVTTPDEPAIREEPALPYRPEVARPAVDFDEFYIGLVLSGRKVYGTDADIYQGLCNNMAELGLEDSRIWAAEECATPEAAYEACHGLASSGCSMVFVAADLYPEWEVLLAEEFPDTVFAVLGGTTAAVSGLPNLVNAWPKTHEMWYVAGAAAGMQLLNELEAGAAFTPFAAFFVEEYTTQAISDYSAFYLGMKAILPDAMLFTFQHSGDPDMAREFAYEAAWGIGCSVLVEHKPDGGSVLAEVALEIVDSGQACLAFMGNMDPARLHYDINGLSLDIHWSWLLGEIIWDYVDGEPMLPDYTIAASDTFFAWETGSALCEASMAVMEEMFVKLVAGEPVFLIDEFTCYTPEDDSAVVNNRRVETLHVWDTDFDGVADHGNAVSDGIVWESEYRSAPVFNLRIEGIEVIY